jgi:hypothetical protein
VPLVRLVPLVPLARKAIQVLPVPQEGMVFHTVFICITIKILINGYCT